MNPNTSEAQVAACTVPPVVLRRIVCAAIRHPGTRRLILGPRHYDPTMRRQIDESPYYWGDADQGFIDQFGAYHDRVDALRIAKEAGQIFRRCGGDERQLFSENLY